jgi:hypothetical protein
MRCDAAKVNRRLILKCRLYLQEEYAEEDTSVQVDVSALLFTYFHSGILLG